MAPRCTVKDIRCALPATRLRRLACACRRGGEWNAATPRPLICVESLLKFLPSKPQPLLVRYGVTAILVAVFFILRVGTGPAAGQYSFIVYIPPILLASILFDRGSGFFATVLSALLVAIMVDWQAPVRHVAPLTLFVVVSLFVVIVGEGMRKALERQVAAQEESELLLQEQGHRIKNDLAIASSLIALQARAHKDLTVRAALESAVARLHVLAQSHDHLQITTGDHVTDMQEYLSEVCWKLGEALRGIRPIAVEVDADRVVTNTQKATRIGLIVNELVTNALKHAFPDDGAGTIWVKLRRTPTELTLVVKDDGIGCPEEAKDGLGSRLTRLLVQQLGGTMTREPATPGCCITITIPSAVT
jgi:two-component sensor histidine kinase